MLKHILFFVAAFGLLGGVAAFDMSAKRCSVAADWTFSGRHALFETCRGRLGMTYDPRFIAFID